MKEKQFLWIKSIKDYFVRSFTIGEDVAAFIGCLFALESHYGENELSSCYNNLCSMKTPFCRISTCKNFADSKTIWAHYDNVFDCYDDFALWLQYQKPLRKQLEDVTLFPFILRSYCSDMDYITKINRIYSQFKSYNHE